MNKLKHYSQMSQDLFVDHLLDSREGYFVDVGCYEPKFINNTYMLEKKGFKGLLLDISPRWIDLAIKHRPASKAVWVDLLKKNFNELLLEEEAPKVIDYIDLDIDEGTVKVLKDVDYDTFSFKVLTIEHDYYAHGDQYRSETRDFLNDKGYQLVCGDVGNNSGPQEDWYVHPSYISKEKWEPLLCADLKHTQVRKLMGIEDERLNWGPENYNAWHDDPSFT